MRPGGKSFATALTVGFLLGVGATRTLQLRPWGHGHMVSSLSRQLSLSAEQKRQLEAIVEAKRRKLDALRAELHPRYEEIRESTRQEIHRILDAGQQAKFDKIEEEWKARREKHPRLDGPPHP